MNRKKRTAGSWKPDAPFINFLAGDPQLPGRAEGQLYDANFLVGLEQVDEEFIDLLVTGRFRSKVFIDSGIYWLAADHARRQNVPFNNVLTMPPEGIIGWDNLTEKWHSTLEQVGDLVWGYVELDIGGMQRKTAMREEAERSGLRPIPVYHPLSDEPEYFNQLCQEYDRVCIGNFAQGTAPDRLRQLALTWETKRRFPDVWIHVLGMAPSEQLMAYPVNSSDSSSWLGAVRWAGIRPKAGGRTVGRLPKSMQYVLKDRVLWVQGVTSSIYNVILETESYNVAMARFAELGIDRWPGIADTALRGAGDIPA